MKLFKEDADTVQQGNECGVSFDNFHEFQEGDVIECFKIKKERASIDEEG